MQIGNNSGVGFNKNTSDKKVTKKLEELEDRIEEVEGQNYALVDDLPTRTSELVNDTNFANKEYVDYAIDGIDKIIASETEPVDSDIVVWINTAENIEDEWMFAQIKDNLTSSSHTWSSELINNEINKRLLQAIKSLKLIKDRDEIKLMYGNMELSSISLEDNTEGE